MTYIYMDAEGVQTLITNLQTYSSQAETSRSDVSTTNWKQKYAADLRSFSGDVTTHKGLLDDQITEVQTRLDAAKAANETGITSTGEDGKIAYYVPDGQQDTKQVVIDSNNVEIARQAWADAEEANGSYNKEQWDAIQARIQAHQDDPAYANAFLATLDAEKVLDLPSRVKGEFTDVTTDKESGYSREINGYPEAGPNIANSLGHMLAAASSTWSDSQGQEYAKQLADAAKDGEHSERVPALNAILSTDKSEENGGGALDYNDAMLASLAQGMEGFTPNQSYKEPSRMAVSEDGNPLSGVVHAMTDNLSAADTWLTVHKADGAVDADKTADRTSDLVAQSEINDNSWTDDWTLLAAREAVAGNSGTAEVGDGTTQAAIVAGALNAVGEGGKVGESGQDKIILSSSARDSVSIALSSYPYGFQKSALSENRKGNTVELGGDSWAEGMPRQPLVTNKALANLVGQVGENDEALARLAGSQEAFNKIQTTGESVKDDPQPLSTALNRQANARGFVAGAIARQHEGDAAAKDERVGAWANAVSTAVNAVPLPQAKGAGAVLNIATSFATNAGKNAASQGAKNGVTKMFGGNENKTKDNEEAVKAAGTSSSAINETLMLLGSGEYSQADLAKAAKNSTDKVSSVLESDGTLTIDPSGISFDSLTSDQETALLEIADHLPSDGHAPLANFGETSKEKYGEGYDIAHRQ